MSDKSGIEWTDATWNPVTGCTKVSPGCAHCYAEAVTLRFRRGPAFLPGVGEIVLHPDRLDQPLRWKRPRKIFVNSMSDLFHEDIPDDFISEVFWVMGRAERHTFQVLTKRPERALEWFTSSNANLNGGLAGPRGIWPLANVWLGVSVENQVWADQRIPLLLETPAAVRFLSVEPLLKAVDLGNWMEARSGITGERLQRCPDPDEAKRILSLAGTALLDWVIVGGESGPRARPMEAAWVRDIRDQCVAVGVPFFLKQWGGSRPGGEAMLDGREWREFPE